MKTLALSFLFSAAASLGWSQEKQVVSDKSLYSRVVSKHEKMLAGWHLMALKNDYGIFADEVTFGKTRVDDNPEWALTKQNLYEDGHYQKVYRQASNDKMKFYVTGVDLNHDGYIEKNEMTSEMIAFEKNDVFKVIMLAYKDNKEGTLYITCGDALEEDDLSKVEITGKAPQDVFEGLLNNFTCPENFLHGMRQMDSLPIAGPR